jgi:hypothetical protein
MNIIDVEIFFVFTLIRIFADIFMSIETLGILASELLLFDKNIINEEYYV